MRKGRRKMARQQMQTEQTWGREVEKKRRKGKYEVFGTPWLSLRLCSSPRLFFHLRSEVLARSAFPLMWQLHQHSDARMHTYVSHFNVNVIRGFIFIILICDFKYLKTCPIKGKLALMALNWAKIGHRQRVVVLGYGGLGKSPDCLGNC